MGKLKFGRLDGDPPCWTKPLTPLPRIRALPNNPGHARWEVHMQQEVNRSDFEKQQLRDRIAQLMARNDRRHYPRLAQSGEISIQQLSPRGGTTKMISADMQNLSRGGICIGSRVPLVTSSVVQCHIGLPRVMYAIPTLMQVVWRENITGSEYAVGLRDLFF